MPIVIKKRISLDFLGEEYKESYIVLKAISVGEYENLKGTVKDEVVNRFIEGEVNQDDGVHKLTKENLEELPGEVFVKAFAAITSIPDPKDLGQSLTPSITEPQPPQN